MRKIIPQLNLLVQGFYNTKRIIIDVETSIALIIINKKLTPNYHKSASNVRDKGLGELTKSNFEITPILQQLCQHIESKLDRYKAFGETINHANNKWSIYCRSDNQSNIRCHYLTCDNLVVIMPEYTPGNRDHNQYAHIQHINQFLRHLPTKISDRKEEIIEKYDLSDQTDSKCPASPSVPSCAASPNTTLDITSIRSAPTSSHRKLEQCINSLIYYYHTHTKTSEKKEKQQLKLKAIPFAGMLFELLDPNHSYFSFFQLKANKIVVGISSNKEYSIIIPKINWAGFFDWVTHELKTKPSPVLKLLIEMQNGEVNSISMDSLDIEQQKLFSLLEKILSKQGEVPAFFFDIKSNPSLMHFWTEYSGALLPQILNHFSNRPADLFPKNLENILQALDYNKKSHRDAVDSWFTRNKFTLEFCKIFIMNINPEFLLSLALTSNHFLIEAIKDNTSVMKRLSASDLNFEQYQKVQNLSKKPQPKKRHKKKQISFSDFQTNALENFNAKVTRMVTRMVKGVAQSFPHATWNAKIIPVRQYIRESFKVVKNVTLTDKCNSFTGQQIFNLLMCGQNPIKIKIQQNDIEYTIPSDFPNDKDQVFCILNFIEDHQVFDIILRNAIEKINQEGPKSSFLHLLVYHAFLHELINNAPSRKQIRRIYFRSAFPINKENEMCKRSLLNEYIFQKRGDIDLNIVKSLIKMGADVNSSYRETLSYRDIYYSPVVLAIGIPHFGLLKLLYNSGANLDVTISPPHSIDHSLLKAHFVLREHYPNKQQTLNLLELTISEHQIVDNKVKKIELKEIIRFLDRRNFWSIKYFEGINMFASTDRLSRFRIDFFTTNAEFVSYFEQITTAKSLIERRKTIQSIREQIFDKKPSETLFLATKLAMIAIEKNHSSILVDIVELFSLKLSDLIYAYTPDQSEAIYSGITLLHLSIRLRKIDCIKTLVSLGASWNNRDEEGKSCYSYLNDDYDLKQNLDVPEIVTDPDLQKLFNQRLVEFQNWSIGALTALLMPSTVTLENLHFLVDGSLLKYSNIADLMTVYENLITQLPASIPNGALHRQNLAPLIKRIDDLSRAKASPCEKLFLFSHRSEKEPPKRLCPSNCTIL